MHDPIRVLIGVCSYKGPDVHCFRNHYEFMFHLGKLQERSTAPRFQFFLADETGNSLIGQARDRIIESALKVKAHYVLLFDDDMMFPVDTFERLFAHRVPMVGALAFTAREPITPVLYKFHRKWSFEKQAENVDIQPMAYYDPDALMRVDAIGTGVVLIDCAVFERLEAPWFHGAVSAGEDIHFCWKLYQSGIPVYCDTSVKTLHKPNSPSRWMEEGYYLERRRELERSASDHSDTDVRELQAVS